MLQPSLIACMKELDLMPDSHQQTHCANHATSISYCMVASATRQILALQPLQKTHGLALTRKSLSWRCTAKDLYINDTTYEPSTHMGDSHEAV